MQECHSLVSIVCACADDLVCNEECDLVSHCQLKNTIVQISTPEEKYALAMQVLLQCIETERAANKSNARALILAPIVPIVKHYCKSAQMDAYKKLCVSDVIGCPEIDAWQAQEWQDRIEHCNVLVTTPQLLLNALDDLYVTLSHFCVLVVDSCQHCKKKHPFATILRRHATGIRILGLSEQLIKRTVKGDERECAIL